MASQLLYGATCIPITALRTATVGSEGPRGLAVRSSDRGVEFNDLRFVLGGKGAQLFVDDRAGIDNLWHLFSFARAAPAWRLRIRQQLFAQHPLSVFQIAELLD